MAANGDNNDHSAEEEWPFDPLMVPDDFDDVMDFLHNPGGGGDLNFSDGLYSPPVAAPMQNLTVTGADGGDPFAAPSSYPHQDIVGSSSSVHRGGFDCTGCQILREIVHSNGFQTTKLCIHGDAGVFFHATLDVYHENPEGTALAPTPSQSFVNFMGWEYAWVKNYLMDYAQQRATGGYTIVQDSISDFFDVLCTGIVGGVGLADADDDHREVAAPAEADNGTGDQEVPTNAGDAIQPMIDQEDMPAASGPSEPKNPVEEQQQQEVRPRVRSRLAMQRERTRKLELHDISRYFHLPMAKAAKELRICTTALKNLRSKFGIERWPHRTIKAIDTEITNLRENGNGNARATDKIQQLTDSRRKIIDGS